MKKIQMEVGDYVRHSNPIINGGLQMSVEDIRVNSNGEIELRCSHFFGQDGVMKTEWFNEKDFILVKEGDGGFH